VGEDIGKPEVPAIKSEPENKPVVPEVKPESNSEKKSEEKKSDVDVTDETGVKTCKSVTESVVLEVNKSESVSQVDTQVIVPQSIAEDKSDLTDNVKIDEEIPIESKVDVQAEEVIIESNFDETKSIVDDILQSKIDDIKSQSKVDDILQSKIDVSKSQSKVDDVLQSNIDEIKSRVDVMVDEIKSEPTVDVQINEVHQAEVDVKIDEAKSIVDVHTDAQSTVQSEIDIQPQKTEIPTSPVVRSFSDAVKRDVGFKASSSEKSCSESNKPRESVIIPSIAETELQIIKLMDGIISCVPG
jgi:hypothetical protein